MPDSLDRSAEADALFDEFQRREEAGEAPDFEALCVAHPEQRRELRALRDGQLLVDRLLPARSATRAGGSDEPLTSLLGVDDLASTERPSLLLQQLEARGPSDDRFRDRAEVARGAMGVVYSALDGLLRRRLALKVALARPRRAVSGEIPSSGDPAVRSVARFLEEAQITSQLDHPGIVPVHDIGLDAEGRVFFAMRLVRGEDLRTVLRHVRDGREGWSQVRAIGVLLKVCEAMSYAHSKGVIHRDLKPSNVMVGRFGEVYVMDWGLARVRGCADQHDLRWRHEHVPGSSELRTERSDAAEEADDDSDSALATMDGDVIGTPAYMSPEQAQGRVALLDERSDVYAVGALMYQMITGEVPFVAPGMKPSARTILARVLDGPPRALESFGRVAPVELVAICEKAMARERMDRYSNMAALAEDLRAYLEGRVVSAYGTSTWAETRKWLRRNGALASALGVGLAAIVLALVLVPKVLDARHWDSILAFKARLQKLQRDSTDPRAWPPESVSADLWIERARSLVVELPRFERYLEQASAPLTPKSTLDQGSSAIRMVRELEIEQLTAELAWCNRMLDEAEWLTPDQVQAQMRPEHHQGTSLARNRRIFNLVRADEPRVCGFEQLAERLAEELVADTVGTTDWHPRFRDTLAFARFRAGHLDAAVHEELRALFEWRPRYGLAWLRDFLGNLRLLLELRARWRSDAELTRRDRLAAQLRVRRLELDADLRLSVGGHNRATELGGIVADLVRLEHELGVALQARAGPVGLPTWEEAIEAIKRSERYQFRHITPQLGLLPLREDPTSGLWEFVHLLSGEPPRRTSDGLEVDAATGMIFVLLPGCGMPTEEKRRRHAGDPIQPFFLSKFEIGEQQWERIVGEWSSNAPEVGIVIPKILSWLEAATALNRVGGWLCMPNSAQWEYGCRAGTATTWWTGDDAASLEGAAVLRYSEEQSPRSFELIGRGAGTMSTRRPNPFGLHDTHGNVGEWCEDGPAMKSGLLPDRTWQRYLRGGGYDYPPENAYSTPIFVSTAGEPAIEAQGQFRNIWSSTSSSGLRLARPLMP